MTNPNLDFMVKCDCGWHGSTTALLTAPHPFEEDDVVFGCPKFRDIDTLTRLCDEPGCLERQTVGWPSKDGYRMTCAKHEVQGAIAKALTRRTTEI